MMQVQANIEKGHRDRKKNTYYPIKSLCNSGKELDSKKVFFRALPDFSIKLSFYLLYIHCVRNKGNW